MLLNPGAVLSGRYEIIEKIGSGGMAVVYRGKDHKLDRYVTIKVLREEYIGDEDFIARFRTEACSAARLSHPNIVRVYDVGEDGEINFIVMEYIHGDTLKKAIKEKAPFDSRSTINVGIQIASALSQAHKSHIVHRDIKPQNILVGTDGVVKVTDFGIARAATASTMTTTANAAGSVHYFSPEQARGGYVDEKSDIYSLGITMFEMITGVLPFQGNNSVSIALKHINDELPNIRQYNPNCSPSLEGIIKKATMKKADERYATIDQLLADLIRARTDTGGGSKKQQDADGNGAKAAAAAGAAGVRMSKRAEAAAQLRAAQEHAEGEKRAQAQHTKETNQEDLDYIRSHKQKKTAEGIRKAEEDHQGKMPRISKEDDYEREYVEAEPVRVSKRPKKKRRNPRLEEDFDNEQDRKAERKVIIAAVITALILIGLITVVGMKALSGGGFGGFVSEEKDIEIPEFIGLTYEEAEKSAKLLGIELVQEGEDYNNYYDEGYIFYQSVREGAMVAKNAKIGVKVSLGLTSEDMPDLVGKTEKEATEKIVSLVGISPKLEYVFDEEAEVEEVVEQEPKKGTKINANSKITLKISKGKEGGNVVVPNVVNSTEAQARRDLEAVGLIVGSVSQAESDRVEKGKVITQTIAANREVPSGSVVNLVISSGAKEIAQPPAPPTDTAPSHTASSGTKYFTVNVPMGSDGSIYVKVVKSDESGTYSVIDEYKDASEFPYSVAVTGTGSGTVTCYVDNVEQWSQSVNFSE
ncbi:MAG: protein kinase [Anaerotignum sp.]|nr:protein kinase [Anaerotignum sp.]